MFDKLLSGYSGIMKFILKIALFIVFIFLIISAFWFGIAQGFQRCYSKTTCSDFDTSSFIIYPAFVIMIGGWLYLRWRRHKKNTYVKAIKAEALAEAGKPSLSSEEDLAQLVTGLLEKYGRLTMDELASKSAVDKDQVAATVRSMLSNQTVVQSVEPDGAYLTLAR